MQTYSELRCVFRKTQLQRSFWCSPVFFWQTMSAHELWDGPMFFKQLVAQLFSEEYLASTGDRAGVNQFLVYDHLCLELKCPITKWDVIFRLNIDFRTMCKDSVDLTNYYYQCYNVMSGEPQIFSRATSSRYLQQHTKAVWPSFAIPHTHHSKVLPMTFWTSMQFCVRIYGEPKHSSDPSCQQVPMISLFGGYSSLHIAGKGVRK